jgi:hypothetical protein
MTVGRERLPNRRESETFELRAAGLDYSATVSRFTDGRVAEIFLSNHKHGSSADTAARDSAVVCSLALQYGVPLETSGTQSYGMPVARPAVRSGLCSTCWPNRDPPMLARSHRLLRPEAAQPPGHAGGLPLRRYNRWGTL